MLGSQSYICRGVGTFLNIFKSGRFTQERGNLCRRRQQQMQQRPQHEQQRRQEQERLTTTIMIGATGATLTIARATATTTTTVTPNPTTTTIATTTTTTTAQGPWRCIWRRPATKHAVAAAQLAASRSWPLGATSPPREASSLLLMHCSGWLCLCSGGKPFHLDTQRRRNVH